MPIEFAVLGLLTESLDKIVKVVVGGGQLADFKHIPHLLCFLVVHGLISPKSGYSVCEFYGYGGNSTDPNFRLALSQENGNITVIDVNKSQMVRLFEGFSPDLKLQTFTGFGNVKGMVWCTNYEGEY